MAFSLKCIDHEENKCFFPRIPNIGSLAQVREREELMVSFARTKRYQQSAIPYCQGLLNNHFREELTAGGPADSGVRAGAGARAGTGAGPEAVEGADAGGPRLGLLQLGGGATGFEL